MRQSRLQLLLEGSASPTICLQQSPQLQQGPQHLFFTHAQLNSAVYGSLTGPNTKLGGELGAELGMVGGGGMLR